MWRVGVAAFLLLLLVGALVEMMFGETSSTALLDRAPSQSFAPAPPVPANPGAPVPRPEVGASPAAEVESAPATSPTLADDLFRDPSPEDDRRPVAALDDRALDRLAPAAPTEPEEPAAIEPSGTAPADLPMPPVRPDPATVPPKEAAPPARDRSSPTTAEAGVPARQVAEAQRRLAQLGYDPGPADGRIGRRTDSAVRQFQQDHGFAVNGQIDRRLVATLETQARARAQLRLQELEAMTPAPAPKPEREQERGVLGSVLGGFQRLLGRDFDSIKRPQEVASYCRANADTWIYDFGREAFIFCGNVVASHVQPQSQVQPASPPGGVPASETAAYR